MKNKILVIGGKGQLGHCLQKIALNYPQYEFDFTDSDTLDITDPEAVAIYFDKYKPDYCINASAYTAVDLAETEPEKAFAVNAFGVENLAKSCDRNNVILIHVSTDYVFDGETKNSYSEDDATNPIGVYGKSKREGEILALQHNSKTIVIRTSWLYSEFNKNFVKTMLNLFQTKDELNVVSDQYGQPTNANDLADVIMSIIDSKDKKFGIYHFSNYPETNWFVFASKIAEFSDSKIKLNPITTDQYPTPAKRPVRSTMQLNKIHEDYEVELKYWEDSLEKCMKILVK